MKGDCLFGSDAIKPAHKRRNVRLALSDVWPGFSFDDSVIYRAISKYFDISIVDDPDYLIVLPYGHQHLKYTCIKILCTGENMTPDFNLFDYAAGFDHLDFGDRYVRTPLYSLRDNFRTFRRAECPSDDCLLNRGFCSFVVSNGDADPIRDLFFRKLSKYKKVDSGGRYMNNIGGPVSSKLDFISRYKFNIAFENSSYPGYTTEKLMDALSVWSIPVYWGNPLVEKDFRLNSMIRVTSIDDVDAAVDEIIRLDNNDDEYLKKCKVDCLSIQDLSYYENKLAHFFKGIFDLPKELARRRCDYGFQGVQYLKRLKNASEAYDRFGNLMHYIHLFNKHILRKP